MPVYSSNSPYFLQYLASTFTREEILNSPEYCYLLEDPDIKDDVEIAFLYQDAKTGGYEEKKEFIQYLLCNGPELDPYTILYYRNIILNNNELYGIYRYEYSYNTIDIQMNLRESVYHKQTSRTGKKSCFDDPGAYLGPFNVMVALGADATEWQNPRNVYAKLAREKITNPGKDVKNVTPDTITNDRRKTQNLTPEAAKAVQKRDASTSVAVAGKIPTNNPAVNEMYKTSGDDTAIETAAELQDALQLSLVSSVGDMYRCYNFAKNYSDFDPKTNKKMPLSSSISYKYPFGIRKTEFAQQSSQFMGPDNMLANMATERAYYDPEDMAYLCMFEPEGSFIINNNNSETAVSYTNLPQGETERRLGKGFSGMKFCPANWSENSGGADKFLLGVFIDLNTAADSIKAAFKDSVATPEDYKKIINAGYMWCKVKLSTGTSASADGSITHSSVILYAPLIGPASAVTNDKLFKIGIDPMLFLTNKKLSDFYKISPAGDNNTVLLSNKKVKDDSTIDGYDERLLGEMDHKNFDVKTDIQNKVGAIRFYIPSNFKEKIVQLFPNLYKNTADEARATDNGVYLEENIFSVGDKGETFVEYKQALFCPQVPNYTTRWPANPKWVTGMECGEIDKNKAIQYISSNTARKRNPLPEAQVRTIVEMFIKYGEQNRVNPSLMVAIFIHETDFGTSKNFINFNNPGGLKKTETEFHSFTTREDGIKYMATRLASNLYSGKTYRDIGLLYSPVCDENGQIHQDNASGINNYWLPNVLSYMGYINK